MSRVKFLGGHGHGVALTLLQALPLGMPPGIHRGALGACLLLAGRGKGCSHLALHRGTLTTQDSIFFILKNLSRQQCVKSPGVAAYAYCIPLLAPPKRCEGMVFTE